MNPLDPVPAIIQPAAETEAQQIERLKNAFLEADKQYQYAIAAGDNARLLQAIRTRNAAWDAYDRAKRKQFKRTFKSKYRQVSSPE